MKRFGLFLMNVLFICLHLIGLFLIEALFFGRLLSYSKGMDWSVWMDIAIYTISILILSVHYLIVYFGQRKHLFSMFSLKLLTAAEIILAVAVFYIFLTGVVYVTLPESVFYFVIQVVILLSRSLYTGYLIPDKT